VRGGKEGRVVSWVERLAVGERGRGRNYGCVRACVCLLAYCPTSVERKTETAASSGHTQKSMYKLPLPPNSRSPTWNVIVILSSLCSVSWKHSREYAFNWMLCALAKLLRRRHSVDERTTARVEERILAGVDSGDMCRSWELLNL